MLSVLAALAVLAAFGYLTRDFWFRQARAYLIGHAYVAAEDATVNLPSIDRAEVCVLGSVQDSAEEFYHDGSERFAVRQRRACDATETQRLVALWRRLPCVYGRSFVYLCHEPTYGLRFWRNDRLVLETTVCWKCGNFMLPMAWGRSPYPFDARHKAAQELLAELKTMLPDTDEPALTP